MKRAYIFILLLLLTGCGIFSRGVQDIPEEALDNYFFTPMDIRDTHAYHIYKNQYKDEMAKVCYLINLVRYSPLMFSRLGRKIKGQNAGRWLDYKLDKYYQDIVAVEDFIEHVGGHSLTTGRPYYIIYEGKKVPMKRVYYNELRRLCEYEEKLKKDKKKAKKVKADTEEKTNKDNPDPVPSVPTP